MVKKLLLKRIENSFGNVRWSPISMRQFYLTDQFGMSREISEKEWSSAGQSSVDSDWTDIPDSEIEECGVLLAHMESCGFIYYLPAYLHYSLRHFPPLVHNSMVLEFLLFSLTVDTERAELRLFTESKFETLDAAQKSVVIEFLKFIESSDELVFASDAREALKSYWNNDSRLNSAMKLT